jgi:hypothetical protein
MTAASASGIGSIAVGVTVVVTAGGTEVAVTSGAAIIGASDVVVVVGTGAGSGMPQVTAYVAKWAICAKIK